MGHSFKDIIGLIRDKEELRILVGPEFQQFVNTMQEQLGYQVDFNDIKYEYRSIIRLFKDNETKERLLSRKGVELISYLGKFDIEKQAFYLRLLEAPNILATLKRVEDVFDWYYGKSGDFGYGADTLVKLAQDQDQQKGLFSEEAQDMFVKLKEAVNYKFKLEDILTWVHYGNFPLDYDLPRLLERRNIQFINKAVEEYYNLAGLEQVPQIPDDWRKLILKLTDNFDYKLNLNTISTSYFLGGKEPELFKDLLENQETQDQLFNKQRIASIQQIQKAAHYRFKLEDVKTLIELPLDFDSFLKELKEHNLYYVFDIRDLDKLARFNEHKDSLFELLDGLRQANITYSFRIEDVEDFIKATAHTSEKAIQKISYICQAMPAYRLKPKDIEQFLPLMENDYTLEDVQDLAQLYTQHKDPYQKEFDVSLIGAMIDFRENKDEILATAQALDELGVVLQPIRDASKLKTIAQNNLLPTMKFLQEHGGSYSVYHKIDKIKVFREDPDYEKIIRQFSILHKHTTQDFDIDKLDYYRALVEIGDLEVRLNALKEGLEKLGLQPRNEFFDLLFMFKGDLEKTQEIIVPLAREMQKYPRRVDVEDYVIRGDVPIDLDNVKDYYQEAVQFYKSIFLPGRELISQDLAERLLGQDLAERIKEISRPIAQNLATIDNPSQIRQLVSNNGAAVMMHATRYDQTNNTVKEIVAKHGLKIMGKEWTVGAFMETQPPAYAQPNFDNGNVVLMFSRDIKISHISVSLDPFRGGGYVSRGPQGEMVRVIPRCTINPGPGQVYDVELNGEQALAFQILQRYALQAQGIDKEIEKRAKQIDQGLGHEFHNNVKLLYGELRKMNYPEPNIVDLRDYYTLEQIKAANNDQDSQIKTKLIGEAINYLKFQPEADFNPAIFIENIKEYWENGLGDYLNISPKDKIDIDETETQMQLFIRKKQRSQFLAALRQMKEPTGERTGFIKDFMNQRQKALEDGIIGKRPLSEVLRMNKILFLGEVNGEETDKMRKILQEVSQEVTAVKLHVMRGIWSEITKDIEAEGIHCFCSGSVGRQEATLTADVDYLILVDSSRLPKDETQRQEKIKGAGQLNSQLSQVLQERFGMRVDLSPIVMSDSLGQSQEIILRKLFDAVVIEENKEASNLLQNLQKEILKKDIRNIKSSSIDSAQHFGKRWRIAKDQLLSGDTMRDFKHEVQRALYFNILNLLLANDNELGDRKIPASTTEKINLLEEIGVLSKKDRDFLQNFSAMVYRWRYRSDIISTVVKYEQAGFRAEKGILDPMMMTTRERKEFIKAANKFNLLFG